MTTFGIVAAAAAAGLAAGTIAPEADKVACAVDTLLAMSGFGLQADMAGGVWRKAAGRDLIWYPYLPYLAALQCIWLCISMYLEQGQIHSVYT